MIERVPLQQISSQLDMLIIGYRMPPNKAVHALIEAYPDEDMERILLAFLETALTLEEMYDQVKREEWNDWLRVDYWEGIAGNVPDDAEDRQGSARLLQMKSELYRAVGFLSLDMVVLRRTSALPITGAQVLSFWTANGSDYFLG